VRDRFSEGSRMIVEKGESRAIDVTHQGADSTMSNRLSGTYSTEKKQNASRGETVRAKRFKEKKGNESS